MPVTITKKKNGVTDEMIDFLIKEIAVVVVSAEKDTTKTKLAASIREGGVILEDIFNFVQSSKNEPNYCPSTKSNS